MLPPCDGHPAVPVSLPLGSASPPGVVGSPAGSLGWFAGKEQVEPATGVVEQADRLGHLLLTADLGDLRDGAHDEADRLAQRAEAVLGRGRVPHGVELLTVLVDVGAARVGQVDHRPALGLLGAHQAFVGQLRHRRVHRARAGAPCPAGALGDLLDDLVAVHRLLGEQREDRRAHVTARPSSTAAAARAAEAARTAEATTRSATGASEAPGTAEARPAEGAAPLAAAEPLAAVARFSTEHRRAGEPAVTTTLVATGAVPPVSVRAVPALSLALAGSLVGSHVAPPSLFDRDTLTIYRDCHQRKALEEEREGPSGRRRAPP